MKILAIATIMLSLASRNGQFVGEETYSEQKIRMEKMCKQPHDRSYLSCEDLVHYSHGNVACQEQIIAEIYKRDCYEIIRQERLEKEKREREHHKKYMREF